MNLRHFWYITGLVGVLTALQAVLLCFAGCHAVAMLPLYPQLAWALIALLLLPVCKTAGPFWPGFVYVLLVACAPVIMIVAGERFPGFGCHGSFFQIYLLCSGAFTGYLSWRQMRRVPVHRAVIPVDGLKGPRLAGSNIIDWLLRLVFAVYIASLFAAIVRIQGNIGSASALAAALANAPGFFAGLAPFVAVLIFLMLITGILLRKKLLIFVGALLNFIYLLLFIGEYASPGVGASFFDVIDVGGWCGLGASIAFLLVLVIDRYIAEPSMLHSAETAADDSVNIAVFPLKWPEILVFVVLSGALIFNFVPFSSYDQQARAAIRAGDLVELQSLMQKYPELDDGQLFEDAVRNGNSETIEFLTENGVDLDRLELNPHIVSLMLNRHDIKLVQRLVDKGLDLTDTKNLRQLIVGTGWGVGDRNNAAIQFLLSHRAERGRPQTDFYLPDSGSENYNYHSYRFNNPLAIAIERGNPAVIKLLDDAGFYVDDEVFAASIASSKPAENLVECRLKIVGEPGLAKPLAFELLSGNLSKIRVDRYLALGVDLTETDAKGNNLFHYFAVSASRNDVVEYVLKLAMKAGCDINAENLSGSKPLWLAAETHSHRAFALLLKLGADREITAPNGTALRKYCEEKGLITILIHLD